MIKYQNPLFIYLEKENIAIDKSEFIFQFQSHPDYPSLLAISDTLNFFSVENGALAVNASEIDLLPDRFIAILREVHTMPQSYFIEKRNEEYFYTSDGKLSVISRAELEARWHDIVLLVEKSDDVALQAVRKTDDKILYALLIIAFSGSLILMEADLKSKLFILFPLIGLLFSLATLKDLLGTKSKLLNDFCNITASTSCTSVIGSEKWKLFKYLNFSDLSTVFFATQLIGTFFFLFSDSSHHFYVIQEVLLIGSIPVIFLSLYFQKFVEKKWCPICLLIMAILFAEMAYLKLAIFGGIPSMLSIGVFISLFLLISVVWKTVKANLLKVKELKEFQSTANRFIRNYEIFRSILTANEKVELSDTPIILGNRNSMTEIAIITNPFCGYCKHAHEVLDEILHRYGDTLKVKVFINADIDAIEEDQKVLFRSLISIYWEEGGDSFLRALGRWFSNPNLEEWVKNHNTSSFNYEKIDAVYRTQHQWCIDNNSFQTPSIFINGYRYPRVYDRGNLKYFIDEIIEDVSLNQMLVKQF